MSKFTDFVEISNRYFEKETIYDVLSYLINITSNGYEKLVKYFLILVGL